MIIKRPTAHKIESSCTEEQRGFQKYQQICHLQTSCIMTTKIIIIILNTYNIMPITANKKDVRKLIITL